MWIGDCVVTAVTWVVFKCTIRAADFCGLLGGSDKLLPHPTVVYGTSKSEVLTLSRWWHARLSWFFLRCFQTQYDYPGWAKWAFAHVPFVMRAYRAILMVQVSHDRHRRGPCSFACRLTTSLERCQLPFFRQGRFTISAPDTRSKLRE